MNTITMEDIRMESIYSLVVVDKNYYVLGNELFSEIMDCRILGIPYKNNLTTMYIILPNNSNRDKLRELQRHLTADNIEELISRMELKTSIVLFPKMHLEYSVDLQPILRKLGVVSLFDQRHSDLSLISSGFENFNIDSARIAVEPKSTIQQEQDDAPFVFSSDNEGSRSKRGIKYKVQSSNARETKPLQFKDLFLNKRITKSNPVKKVLRKKRQVNINTTEVLQSLDSLRNFYDLPNPGLSADAVLHKIDLTINEKGTEGGASTVVLLKRSGTNVVFRVETPFLFLIRHEDTKLPLFYGSVFEPVN